jgi:nucleotide-binding universal stress UspA family protein
MFDHILVPLDGSLLAECVLPHVLSIGQSSGAQVTLLQVLDQGPVQHDLREAVDPWSWNLRKAEAGSYLNKVCARLQYPGLQLATVLDEGPAADRIIKFAHDHEVNLIAMSSHGQSGLSAWTINSVVQKVLLKAYTSTLIVPAYQSFHQDLTGVQYERVFVALDCSPRAEYVLPVAVKLASFHRASLLLAHVVCRPGMPSYRPLTKQEVDMANQVVEHNQMEADRYLQRVCSRLSSNYFDIQACLQVSENPIETLHDLVESAGADLLILSAHGCSGGSRWPYGSVTLSFIAYGTIPLLILQDLSHDEIVPTRAEVAAKEQAGHGNNPERINLQLY